MSSHRNPAWIHVAFRHRMYTEASLWNHNYQRRTEAFFSNMKRRFGPVVKSHVGTVQRKETRMRCQIIDILVAANEKVEKKLERRASLIS